MTSTVLQQFIKYFEFFYFRSIMFITVILGESDESQGYSQVNVNPDCPIRMIYDFIRETFEIPQEVEIDLCDDAGNLVNIYEKEPWENGKNFVTLRTLYFVVLFDRDENGKLVNPVLNLPSDFLTSNRQLHDMRQKIHRQLNPSAGARAGRLSRTRSGSVNNVNNVRMIQFSKQTILNICA